MCNELTVLLPVKDRPGFTIRCLSYFNEIQLRYKVIVADGSIMEDTEKAISARSFTNLDFEYFRFPPDSGYGKFLCKMNDALGGVKSKYVYWACDDDFINFNCIENGITFLDRNPLYSMYTGQVVNFEIPLSKAINRHFGEVKVGNNIYSMKFNIEEIDVIKRLSSFSSIKPFEALHRTSTLKELFSKALEFKITHHYELASLFNYIVLLKGKSYVSEELIVLRQHDTPSSAGSLISVNNSPLGYFKNNSFPDFIFNKLSPFLETEIASKNNISELEVREIRNEVLHASILFYNNLIIKSLKVTPPSRNTLFHKVKRAIPIFLIETLYSYRVTKKINDIDDYDSNYRLKSIPPSFLELVKSISGDRKKNIIIR